MAKRGRKPHPMALAKLKYARHRAQAKFRKIEFKFTFDEWYNWWLAHGVDKNKTDETFTLQDRSRLCMCRKGDLGAYEASNVYAATHVDNARQAHFFEKRKHRNLQKRYQWGTELINLIELRERVGHNRFRREHYRKESYDYWRHSETKFLRAEHRRTYGGKRSRTHYLGADGEWYGNRIHAARTHRCTPETYKKRQQLGTPGYAKRVLHPLDEYIRANSRYPDPIIVTE